MAECCTPVRCGPGYASPAEAMKAPRELLLYTVALYIGTGIQKPDYLATIDADPNSRPTARSSAGWRCPASAMSCTTWGGMPVRPAMATPPANGAI